MMAFENALRAVACDVALPYWDWSSGPSTGVPEACRYPTYINRSGATVANPLYSGPRPAGGQTSRRASIDTTAFDDLASGAQSAMTASSFSLFQDSIDGVHGSVHGRVGGDMGFISTSSYDPIFFLHHANVDRLWAAWQVTHPGSLPTVEANFELQPFNRPFTLQWQRGSDMQSISALDYRYLRFCFILPPFRFWEVVRFAWPWDIRRDATSARLLIKSSKLQVQTMEVRAFVNQPEAGGQTRTIGNEAFAGAVGFFGGHQMPAPQAVAPEECEECAKLGHTLEHAAHARHGHDDHDHPAPVADERFDLAMDITAALLKTNADNEVALKLVVVDVDGNEVPADRIEIEGFEIEIE